MAHYLITGHTGFKGSWLTLLLRSLGHEVSGFGLTPPAGGLFERAGIAADMRNDQRADIRNRKAVLDFFEKTKPAVVIHMAAQPLVREGYRDPVGTYETNVNGTLHVLEASALTDSVEAQLIVTTDKVYRSSVGGRPYVESDPLGGNDPYSSSKAMADLLAQEYLQNRRSKPGAIVRAGNVIGLGDVSGERLIPDIQRAIDGGEPVEVRYPGAVRPFQHVLDCLVGYLAILDQVPGTMAGMSVNVGPPNESQLSVIEVLNIARQEIGEFPTTEVSGPPEMREEGNLQLDSSFATENLGLTFSAPRSAIAASLHRIGQSEDIRLEVLSQIQDRLEKKPL